MREWVFRAGMVGVVACSAFGADPGTEMTAPVDGGSDAPTEMTDDAGAVDAPATDAAIDVAIDAKPIPVVACGADAGCARCCVIRSDGGTYCVAGDADCNESDYPLKCDGSEDCPAGQVCKAFASEARCDLSNAPMGLDVCHLMPSTCVVSPCLPTGPTCLFDAIRTCGGGCPF